MSAQLRGRGRFEMLASLVLWIAAPRIPLLLPASTGQAFPWHAELAGEVMAYVGFRTVGRENEMPLRLRSRIARIIGCTIALLVVAVPLHAMEDEPLIDGAAVASPTLTDVVEPTTEVVEDDVEPAANAGTGLTSEPSWRTPSATSRRPAGPIRPEVGSRTRTGIAPSGTSSPV